MNPAQRDEQHEATMKHNALQPGSNAANLALRGGMRRAARRVLGVLLPLAFLVQQRSVPIHAQQYAGSNCVATMENRSVPVAANGTFVIPNVPVNPGQYRARVICTQPDGKVLGYTSPYTALTANGSTALPSSQLGSLSSQPSMLKVLVISGALSSVGATVQLEAQSIDPTAFAYDATPITTGTTWSSSNPAVATVDGNGLVTATGPGTVIVTARNDGLASTISLTSFGLLDSDGDGLPDVYELANGLNPYDPTDANLDFDNDGLTNLQEFQLGTNPRAADTDGDGLTDGDEIKRGTNPLVADTDNDGLTDGDEVRLGTNPLVADTDGDGIPDGVEVKIGTNPLVADATTTVTGHVTNSDGKPYTGASVSVFTYFTTLTDTTGAFSLVSVPVTLGNLVVSARAVVGTTVYNGASPSTPPNNGAATDVGTIQLGQSPGQVSGTVYSPDNKPVAGALLTVAQGSDTRTSITDGAGLYVVTGLQPGAVSVAAFDPLTSLRGQATGMLTGNALTLNVTLGGFGTVSGTVRNAAGTPVPAGVPVVISGALNASTITDTLGHYTFAFVPLGAYIVDATDSNGNHGRTAGTITATAMTNRADVQFLGRGTVSGVVADAQGNPVAGAVINLRNAGLFDQRLTATTNSLGQYSIAGVFVGTVNVAATVAASNIGSSGTGNVTADGQTVTVNLTLQPTANLTGTIFRKDGTTPVSNASVSLSNSAFTATANAAGQYSIANIPLGTYTVMASDPSSGDRGSASAALSTAGQAAITNVNMVGVGTVVVTVLDASGATVSGATVEVDGTSPYNQVQNGVTSSAGVATFNQQLSGAVTVKATNPSAGLSGTASATVTAGSSVSVTVNLQPSGTISGTVFKHDAVTPLASATLLLDNGERILADANGLYSFAGVPSGTHTVQVVDSIGNLLAYNGNIVISTQGQVVTANFVIVARGTVTGHITFSDGSVAAGASVQVTSSASGANRPLGGQSNASGIYTTANVPVGSYTVAAQLRIYTYACIDPRTNQSVGVSNDLYSNISCPAPDYVVTVSEKDYYGSGSGALSTDGQTVTTDIQISQQIVPSTTTYTDANGFTYPLHQNGGIYDGSFGVFKGDGATHEGGSLLSLVQNGVSTAFTGSPLATGGGIEQDGLDGLNVTRKIYVPSDGYFARYLELLSNPGSTDITVGVQLNSYLRSATEDFKDNSGATQAFTDVPHILLTSSGDTTLDVANPTTPDNWVTLGGPADRDPFFQDQFADTPIPAIAEVFSGPGAPMRLTSATITRDTGGAFATLAESYATVRVPAGGTIGLLHFVVQENEYSAANASAARLVQLPKEALLGLTPTDTSTISNFVVPTAGTSTVPDLPTMNNQVTGFVYASDTTTKVPAAPVYLQSTDPIFARTYVAAADANGAYSFQGQTSGLVITPEKYNVYASHPVTSSPLTAACAQSGHFTGNGCAIDSPTFSGTFDTNATQSSTDITFSNTGILRGTVSRGPTVLNVAGTVTVNGSALTPITIPLQSDGTYFLTGVLPGSYTITAAVTNTLLQGQTSATVTAGSTTTANITIIEAGAIQGTVTRSDGTLPVGDTVNLRTSSVTLQTSTDTSGHYAFTDVPIGTYTVDVYDSLSNSAATATAVVTSNATTTTNLALQSSGTVNGTVSVNDGSSVSGLTVTLLSTTSSGTQSLSTTTDANGHFTFTSVKPGTIAVHTATAAGLQGTGNGSLPLAGQTVTINISLVSAGNVTGTVFQGDGTTKAVGVQVTISPAPLTGSATVNTDANGTYLFSNEPFGGFTVTATNSANGDTGSASGQIQANGQLRTVNITLNGFGTLVVRVVDGNSSAVPNASVSINNFSVGTKYSGKTDSTGTATFSNIAAGPFSASATDPVTGLLAQQNGTLASGATQNITVTLQSTGTIQGVVYLPNGTSPAAGATVQLNTPYGPTTTTAADGSYTFTSQSVGGAYAVQARDASGLVRANAPSQQLTSTGQVITQNLTFVGVGSISGTVLNADGSRAENQTLSIQGKNSSAPSTQTTTTGGDGTYSVAEVPVGAFTVTVTGLPSNLAGFTSGSIANDGDHQTADIQIQSSSVQLPITLTDADGFSYPINANGTYGVAIYNFFGYSPFYYAQQLALTVNSATSSFADGSSPLTSLQSLSGQQIEINQPALAGLSVTRKIYVPTDGYFARRLEVLQNPTSSPITVSLALSGTDRYSTLSPTVISTSNGTTTVDNTILWAVDDDDAGASPYPASQPAHANVFAGAGAPTGLSAVTRSTNTIIGFGNNPTYTAQTWNYTYKSVTIPASGKVSFLFFTAQESASTTAKSAAQRLVQLPGEALTGLSSDDLASVVNFVVPSAPLAALHPPAITASLNGMVKTGDGSLPIPNAVVYAQSTDPEYGGGVTATADSNGAYATPALNGASYAVEATDPSTTSKSPVVSGTFLTGTSSQAQDILFTNTGVVAGVVKATGTGNIGTGTIYMAFYCAAPSSQTTGGSVVPANAAARFKAHIASAQAAAAEPSISGGTTYCGSASQNYAADGTFRFLTIPAGNQQIEASIYTPTGTYIYLPQGSGSYSIDVAAAQTTNFTFTIPASGTINGKVTNADGTPAVGVQVSAVPSNYNKGTSDSVKTAADGTYTMSTLLLDTYTVTAYDSTTATSVFGTTTLTQDSVNTVNLTFLGKGTVVATVHYANGNIPQGAFLSIASSVSANYAASGTADANGQYTFANVPSGRFTIKAYYPGQNFFSTTTGTLTGTGSTQQVAVTLTPVGTISGTVTFADGSPAAAQYVSVSDGLNIYGANAQTDSAGNYALFPVPADRPLTVSSSFYDSKTGKTFPVKATNQMVPGDAQTLTVNLRYPGLANVKVSVLNLDNTPAPSVSVSLRSSDGVQRFTQTTGSDGSTTFNDVEEASFVAYANNASSNFNLGSTKFTVGPSDDGTTVQVTIHTTPVGTVQGQVYASDGTTIIRDGYDVYITDVDAGSSNYNYPSNGEGYSFTNVQVGAGGYSLTAEHGPIKQTVTGNITTQGQTITQNFTLPISSISGTVFLHDGVTPVPYANVLFSQSANGSSSTYFETNADANGTYQISGAVAGMVTVQAQDDNDVSASVPVTLSSDTAIVSGVNITLPATGTVLGTVYNNNGQIIPNAYVNIESSGNNGGFSSSVQADDFGNYTASDIPVGNITVSVYDDTSQTSLTGSGVLINDGDSVTIDVGNAPAMAGGRIFGTVYDANGDPSPAATVTIKPSADPNTVLTATTDSDGMYASSGLALGDVTVSAVLSDGTNLDPVTGTVPDTTTAVEIDLGLQNAGNVSGIVTDNAGNPLAGYDINAASTGDTSTSYGEGTGSGGVFYFSGIAPGTVTLTVTDQNGNVIGTNTGVLPYGGNLTLNVKTSIVLSAGRRESDHPGAQPLLAEQKRLLLHPHVIQVDWLRESPSATPAQADRSRGAAAGVVAESQRDVSLLRAPFLFSVSSPMDARKGAQQ